MDLDSRWLHINANHIASMIPLLTLSCLNDLNDTSRLQSSFTKVQNRLPHLILRPSHDCIAAALPFHNQLLDRLQRRVLKMGKESLDRFPAKFNKEVWSAWDHMRPLPFGCLQLCGFPTFCCDLVSSCSNSSWFKAWQRQFLSLWRGSGGSSIEMKGK